MITEVDHNTSQIKTDLAIGEVKITTRDRLQCHEKIHHLRIPVDNPDQIHLTLQCLIDLEIRTRLTIYPTKRNSQPLTMVTNRKWFDSLRLTMKSMNYLDYAL